MPAVVPKAEPLIPVDEIRYMARVPAPLSILVWIFTALGAGSITVFQVLLMPLMFRMARYFNREDPPQKRAELEINLARIEQTVVEVRRSLSFVAGKTHPIRDDKDEGQGGPKQGGPKG